MNGRRLALTIALGSALAFAFLPLACRLPNFLIADDGYFYAEIAYRLATEGRSTFDGIHTTSGYHLPWAFILAAVSRVVALFTLDHTVHLWAHLAVALSIAIATARHFFKSYLFQGCAFVLIVSNFSLTEMVLAAPILLALLRGGRREAWFAFLLPLVRIDLLCVPLVVAVLTLPRDRHRAVLLGAAALVGMAIQLATMRIMFGHFVSVAALLKATHPLDWLVGRLRFNFGESTFQDLFYAAHAAFAVLALRRDKASALIVLASLSFLVFHTVFNIVRPWYWVPSAVGVLLALEGAGPDRLARAAVAFLMFAFVLHTARVHIVYAQDRKASATFLAELRRLVPPGTRVFTADVRPGFLGFFSGLDVVDGDGLVNDYDYASRLRDGQLSGYLEEERICYVVNGYPDESRVVDLMGLVVEAKDATRLAAVRGDHPIQSDFVLYRLVAPRCAP